MNKYNIVVSCCFLVVVIFNSCKKTGSSTASSNFTGRWIGPGTLSENGVVQTTQTDTLVFVAGTDGNHVILQDTSGSCKGGTVLTFVLNGNAISLPTTAATDGCGNKSTDSGNGNLSGGTLTFNLTETVSETVPGGSSTGGDTVITIIGSVALTLTKK